MQQAGDILVVDDEVDIVNLVVDLLQDEGYQVRSASNGEGAFVAIKQQLPALILIDMYMPHMTGLMFIERLQSQGLGSIPVILMTASPRVVDPLLNQGPADYLTKPFDLDDLLAAVARHIPANSVGNKAYAVSEDTPRNK